MPAIATTIELFPRTSATLEDVKAQQSLLIKAGAIRSTIDSTSDKDNYVLTTEWNIIGQNDDSPTPDAESDSDD